MSIQTTDAEMRKINHGGVPEDIFQRSLDQGGHKTTLIEEEEMKKATTCLLTKVKKIGNNP